MKNTPMHAVAVALILNPLGVHAEILSQSRLAEILTSDAPGPVNVEAMQSRDRDLLVTLGVSLRDKYGSILDGSEVVFTRTEKSGRIVYRMDFINVKTQEHAAGICQILEMEKCVITSRNGDANLISAEFDEDGLLSLDEYVPVSSAVRMEKLPTNPRENVESQKPLNTMRLPLARPDIPIEFPVDDAGESPMQEVMIELPSVSTEDVRVDGQVVTPAIEVSARAMSPNKLEAPTSDIEDNIDNLADETPAAPLDLAPDGVELDELEITIDRAEAKPVDHILPIARPSASVLASMPTMLLPMGRPEIFHVAATFEMKLPDGRPVASFGLADHLPPRRDLAIGSFGTDHAEDVGKFGDVSLISGPNDGPSLFDMGHSIVLSESQISGSLTGIMGLQPQSPMINLPGFGDVEVSETIPTIQVRLSGDHINTNVLKTSDGIEMEIDGMDEKSVAKLPRVFVLNFAEEGVTAFPNARIEPTRPAFKIASVVMNDSFSRPFDIRGDGQPDLQKLPHKRPDFSVFGNDIELVSGNNANILLEKLFESPVRVADATSAEAENPGDLLMRGLSSMGGLNDDYTTSPVASAIGKDLQSATSAVEIKAPEVAVVVPSSTTEPGVEQQPVTHDVAEKDVDGLLKLEEESNRAQAMAVLSQIARQVEQDPVVAVAPVRQKPVEMQQITRSPSATSRGIFDVAKLSSETQDTRSNPELRIELSYASSRNEVSARAKELETYIPDVIMKKGRFYGYRVPSADSVFIIGIEAVDLKGRDDIIWYLEKMEIPWAVRQR